MNKRLPAVFLSDFIEQLKELLATNGDLPVTAFDPMEELGPAEARLLSRGSGHKHIDGPEIRIIGRTEG